MSKWTFEPYTFEMDSDLDPGIDGGPLVGFRPVWLENERGLELYIGGLYVSLTWIRQDIFPLQPFFCPCGDPLCDYGQ